MGRKDKYESHIKPYFNDIKQWISDGATERQVAYKLGIAYPTFNKYKQRHSELVDLISNAKRNLIADLRGALVKKALGFKYEETKSYSKVDETTGSETTYIETTQKCSLPDVAAINLLLKNLDTDNWNNDPAAHRLKERELKMRERLAEKQEKNMF